MEWATKSILAEYNHQVKPNRIPNPETVTFIEGFKEGTFIDKYSPYTATIGFPSKVDANTLMWQSSAISHEMAHHAIYCLTGDWKFQGNGVHYASNKNWTVNRPFRKGLIASYRMVYFDIKRIVDTQTSIEACCRTEIGSPQPYWA